MEIYRSFVLFALLTLSAYIFSNEKEFGKVNSQDFNENPCTYEPDASAVVLYDIGSTRITDIEGEPKLITERHVRIRILNDDGVHWGNLEIPFYQSDRISEGIYNLRACTYNMENTGMSKSVTDQADAHKIQNTANWWVWKLAIPNVHKGSVIEYTYFHESNYLYDLADWKFQWSIPVLYSSYSVGMVPFFQYQFRLQGATKFDEYKTWDGPLTERMFAREITVRHYQFAMKDLPSFSDESFLASSDDYVTKIDFQLSLINFPSGMKKTIMSTWPELIKEISEEDEFGKYIHKAGKEATKLIDLERWKTLSESARFDSVINFMKTNFIWDKISRLSALKKPSEFVKKRSGNSAEINLFAVGIFKQLNMEVYPVILSTRSHGKVKEDYPFVDAFNDQVILVKVDGALRLTDGTDPLLKNNRIPTRCLNGKGLLIDQKFVNWISLNTNITSREKTDIIIDLSKDTVLYQIRTEAYEYKGLEYQKRYGNSISDLNKHLTELYPELRDDSTSIQTMDNQNGKYEMKYSVFSTATKSSRYSLQPFLNEIPSSNPFKKSSRKYPVDMEYPMQHILVSSIRIPKGYIVKSKPEDAMVMNEGYVLNFNSKFFNNNGSDEVIRFTLFFELKKPIFSSEEYLGLRDFFQTLIDKSREKVIIERLEI